MCYPEIQIQYINLYNGEVIFKSILFFQHFFFKYRYVSLNDRENVWTIYLSGIGGILRRTQKPPLCHSKPPQASEWPVEWLLQVFGSTQEVAGSRCKQESWVGGPRFPSSGKSCFMVIICYFMISLPISGIIWNGTVKYLIQKRSTAPPMCLPYSHMQHENACVLWFPRHVGEPYEPGQMHWAPSVGDLAGKTTRTIYF